MTPEQHDRAAEVQELALQLNEAVRRAREAGLDVMLAVNEPKAPLGVQSVHPVVQELTP